MPAIPDLSALIISALLLLLTLLQGVALVQRNKANARIAQQVVATQKEAVAVEDTAVSVERERLVTQLAIKTADALDKASEARVVAEQSRSAATLAVNDIGHLQKDNDRLESQIAANNELHAKEIEFLKAQFIENDTGYKQRFDSQSEQITDLQQQVKELKELLRVKTDEASADKATIARLEAENAALKGAETEAA